ncbi:hypothetical protein PHMEG_00033672, partial [Phytophthora megakarya]
MGKSKVTPVLTQHLWTFLQARLITVPANGQCAFAAFYFTTVNADSRTTFTAENVYALILANLPNDVAAGLVDPIREICRLYPDRPTPASKEAATAALYEHYQTERRRSVNTKVLTSFWAGPEVLRAMAQHLREPLYHVAEEDANHVAHVQRYYYKDYVLPNGQEHESGCGGPMEDAQVTCPFEHYQTLHILPTIMVLRRTENHFYGVGHHPDTFLRWHAEGDPEFAATIVDPYEWLMEINVITPHEPADIDDMDLNLLDPTDTVNIAMLRRMPMQERLDVAHQR